MVKIMSKGGFERAADLAQLAKAIADIIKAGLKGGWAGAATAALKAYWPKLLPIAIVAVLLPAIIVCCLPAILFGFFGSSLSKEEIMQNCYENLDSYRNRQLNEIKSQQGTTCNFEFVNESFDKYWFIAIHSVKNDNDIEKMSEHEIIELVKKTYKYEIVDPEPKDTSSSNPWDDTTHEIPKTDEELTENANPSKIIKVTTQTPAELMRSLNFNDEKTDWATIIFETYSVTGPDMVPNDISLDIREQIKNDDTPYIGGEYISPFPDLKWHSFVTSEYGRRVDPITEKETPGHNGIDIAPGDGTEIHAANGGTVLYVRRSEEHGNYLAINHGGRNVTLYAHCGTILVTAGDVVTQGQIIAKVGNTGCANGSCLHLEFIINGIPKNPRAYLPKLS